MTRPLEGSLAKLRRAKQHLRSLNTRIQRYLNRQPYFVDPDIDHNPQAGEEIPLVARVLRDPPVVDWGAVIGDLVHNLRSALDILAWDLTEAHTGPAPPDPIPRGNPWRDVSFPIILDRTDWHSGLQKVWGVKPSLTADFERLQPFAGRHHKRHPERHPLWVLQELWTRDKHRSIVVVGSLLQVRKIGTEPFHPAYFRKMQEVKTPLIERRSLGPFQDGTELGRLRIDTPISRGALHDHMYVNLQFIFDVAFEKGPPAYGGRVMQVLNHLYETVAGILIQFEPELR